MLEDNGSPKYTERLASAYFPAPPPKRGRKTKFRKPKPLDDTDRDALTSALFQHLLKPGLIPACEILIMNMDIAQKDALKTARGIVAIAKELVLRGFPEAGPKGKAAALKEELDEIGDEDDMGTAGGGGEESPDGGTEEADLE